MYARGATSPNIDNEIEITSAINERTFRHYGNNTNSQQCCDDDDDDVFIYSSAYSSLATTNRNLPFLESKMKREKKIQTLSIRIILKQRQPKYKHSNNNKNITPIKQNKYQSTRTTTNLNCIPCMIHGRMGDRGKEKLNNKCISANEVVFCV